ncbi:GNAT family N-acetyltransferase [Paenibacillus harenae]|uniref:GNAT family N-acetyltransferase n=1 Tax=Paenibacillus harenae TaxID=306543 RepID=UPI0004928A9B|nr:GNAT family N-acetyltransferase [Paenibacillus harenae]
MIRQLLAIDDWQKIPPLLGDARSNVVINGVLSGINLGKIFVDRAEAPKAALIWAQNEMFYLVGSYDEAFYEEVEALIVNTIKPEALRLGEDCFNLEVYSSEEAHSFVTRRFSNRLIRGERVPFIFDPRTFAANHSSVEVEIPGGYTVMEMDQSVIAGDAERIMAAEILKFWASVEGFLEKGFGFCVMKDGEVIGTCLSVYVGGLEYEIGINTYGVMHRGKGLATAMAAAFIRKCLWIGGTPHWTTEHFRKDSIAIARKLGFKQLPNYPVYYLSFQEFH